MKIITSSIAVFLCCMIVNLFPCLQCAADEGKERATSLEEAVALFEQGNTDKAIEVMKKVVAAEPQNAEAYDRLGYFFLKKSQFDDSLNAFAAALKINPALRTSKTGTGLALFKKGDLKGAEAILTEALSLNPNPAPTHYALGLVYEKLADYEKSVLQFKEGIKTFRSSKK